MVKVSSRKYRQVLLAFTKARELTWKENKGIIVNKSINLIANVGEIFQVKEWASSINLQKRSKNFQKIEPTVYDFN
jgi:hypothetical protein